MKRRYWIIDPILSLDSRDSHGGRVPAPEQFRSRRFESSKIPSRAVACTVTDHLYQSNVLVDNNQIPKLCDFGSSRIGYACSHTIECHDGTLQWDSPELFEDRGRTNESDMWALGCLALEVSLIYEPLG